MEKPLLSIIIPAYNAERTIRRAVISIQKTLDTKLSYELLIVENGSTDGTLEVVSSLCCNNLYLLHSETGVSHARNIGIQYSSGKWVMFLDADDELLPESGKFLQSIATDSDADLCLFGHRKGKKNLPVCKKNERYTSAAIEEIRIRMLQHPTKYMQVWAKLFKRSTIIQNNVHFDPELRLSEDSDFVLNYTRYCKKIELFPTCIYSYTLNQGSVMHTFDGRKIFDYAKAMELTQKKLIDESENIKNAYWQYVVSHFHIAMVNETFCLCNKITFLQKKELLRKATDIPIFKMAIQQSKKDSSSGTNKLFKYLLQKKFFLPLSAIYSARALQKEILGRG